MHIKPALSFTFIDLPRLRTKLINFDVLMYRYNRRLFIAIQDCTQPYCDIVRDAIDNRVEEFVITGNLRE